MSIRRLYQNVPDNNKYIQKYGCYYIDLCNIYQEVANHQLEYSTVEAVYEMAQRMLTVGHKPFMTYECYINDVQGISQLISGITGIPVYMEVADEGELYNFLIAKMHRRTSKGKDVYHFVEVYKDDPHNIKRDPWQGGSRTAKEGVIVGLRPIKARLLG